MTMVDQLAAFVAQTAYEQMSPLAQEQLKIRVLDSLGCAIGALEGEPILKVREQVTDFGGTPLCTLIGDGRTAPDRAAFYNGALVRYLDFNDSYLAKGETCHPSDNLAPVLAASEYAKQSGAEFLTALAVAYQVQCRLSDVAPVRAKGFDHTTQGAYAIAAGASRALHLDPVRTASALAICGTAFNALRVTRTGTLSHWKGLAYPNTAFGCLHGVFLASRGITGPIAVFEGNKGFMEAIAGPFEINWPDENLECVTRTIIKEYNAEVHSQSTLEGIIELKQEFGLPAEDIDRIDIEIFDVAYNIIGGGEEGDKKAIETKEQADHSLPYLVATAILEGQVMPEHYLAASIQRPAVQSLLQKVFVRPTEELSALFPHLMPSRITVRMSDGRVFVKEKHDYEGFHTRPIRWETAIAKFNRLSAPFTEEPLRQDIVAVVRNLNQLPIADLVRLFNRIGGSKQVNS